jgi:hypothetical protein
MLDDFDSHHTHGPELRLTGILQLPNRPRQWPLNWQYLAKEFDRFVSNPSSRVSYRDPTGRLAFGIFGR